MDENGKSLRDGMEISERVMISIFEEKYVVRMRERKREKKKERRFYHREVK